MNIRKAGSAIVVIAVGLACLVFGIMFIMQAGSSEQKVADEIQPLQLSEVNATYGQVSAALAAARDPAEIQSLTMQKTSLGLAKANIGTIKFVKNSGIVDIIVGAGLVVIGAGLIKRD